MLVLWVLGSSERRSRCVLQPLQVIAPISRSQGSVQSCLTARPFPPTPTFAWCPYSLVLGVALIHFRAL